MRYCLTRLDWEAAETAFCFGVIVLVLSILPIGFLWTKVANEHVIDAEIAMYEEENSRIEERINTLVSNYLEYEQQTFAEFKPSDNEDLVAMASLFPELKSDTLVQEQLSIYVDNNAKIKSLREQKIGLAVCRWLLYFGK